MDEATKARLFERFYKGDASRSGRGTGLGLAIARDIVHLHGGTLTVESQLGAGTVFYVTL
jgi:signal transduction histidine kinase